MSKDRLHQASLDTWDDCTIRMRLFFDFLHAMKNCFIRIDGYNPDSDEYTSITVPALHRWKPEYKKRVLAKMYRLNDWYKEHRSPVTMVTLTTHQKLPDGSPMPYEMQIDLLKSSYNKTMKILKKEIDTFSYIWVIEPHKTGYAHMHLLIFGTVPDTLQLKIKDLWNNKYGAGGFRDAVKFDVGKAQRDLASAGAYVFKYLAKTLDYDALDDLDSGYSTLSSNVWYMSQHDTDFKGVRLWGSSKDLTSAMKYENPNDCDTIWFRVMITSGDDGTYSPVWLSPDLYDFPECIEQFDDWYSSQPPPDNLPDQSIL